MFCTSQVQGPQLGWIRPPQGKLRQVALRSQSGSEILSNTAHLHWDAVRGFENRSTMKSWRRLSGVEVVWEVLEEDKVRTFL